MYGLVKADLRYVRKLIDEHVEYIADKSYMPVRVQVGEYVWGLINTSGQYCILAEHPSEQFKKTKEYRELCKNIAQEEEKRKKWQKPSPLMFRECLKVYHAIRSKPEINTVYMEWDGLVRIIRLQDVATNIREHVKHSYGFAKSIVNNLEHIYSALKRNVVAPDDWNDL